MTLRVDGPLRSLALGIACVCRLASADGVITKQGCVVAEAPPTGGSRDEATDLSRALSGLAFVDIASSLGAESSADRGFAAGLTVDTVSAVYPFGGFTGGHLGYYQHDRSTVHLRASVVNVAALFACRDRAGELHLPILGQSRYACEPGGRLGIAGVLGDVGWAPRTGRVAARWGELLAVVNVAGAPSSMAYLGGHVDLAVGVDAESLWHGDDDARHGSDHFARGIARLAAMIRSDGSRWEASAIVEARPAIAGTVRALRDSGVTGQAAVVYHRLWGQHRVVSFGLVAHAGHWTDPSTSSSPFDSVVVNTSLFAGATVEVRSESPR